MTMLDERTAASETVSGHPPTARPPADAPLRSHATWRSPKPLSPTLVGLLLVAWFGFLGAALAAAPPPDPDAVPTSLDVAISGALTLALMGTATALAARLRMAAPFTVFGGLVLSFAAVTCALTGHTGAWILIQFGAGLGLATTGWAVHRVSR